MLVSSEVIEILDYLGDKLGIAIDWTSENIIPYLQQLLNKFVYWEFCTSIAWIAIMALFIILIFIIMSRKGVKEVNKDVWDEHLWILAGVVILILCSVICSQIFDIIKCQVFPEKVLYDYMKTLLNNKN